MKKKIQEFLVQKEFEKWQKDNKPMWDDIVELADRALRLRLMWGIPVKLSIDKDYKEPEGRGYGIADEIEELYKSQIK